MVRFQTELNYRNTADVIEAVRKALSPKPKSVFVDLSEVPLIDSSGLRALLQAKRNCEEVESGFEIIAVSDAAKRIIVMSGLADVFGLSDILAVPEPLSGGKRSKDGGPQKAASAAGIGSDELPDVFEVLGGRTDTSEENRWRIYEYVAANDPSVIADLREKATEAAREAGAHGETLCDIQISVGEALTNAYRHGNCNSHESKIHMRCMTCHNVAFGVEIQDEGEGFDVERVCEPDPNQMRDHGMGIYLMRQAMDFVAFYRNCPGMMVRMFKRLG